MEVLEQLQATGRCFVRATTITGEVEHGWVPEGILEAVQERKEEEEEEEDERGVPRVKSVLITDHDQSISSQQVSHGDTKWLAFYGLVHIA